jgi:hypothetical protein
LVWERRTLTKATNDRINQSALSRPEQGFGRQALDEAVKADGRLIPHVTAGITVAISADKVWVTKYTDILCHSR